jgi:hypothetical protein
LGSFLTFPDGTTQSTAILVGPRGPQWVEGLEGPIGFQGSTGLTGPAGPVGPQGPIGVPGAAGATGPAGAIGPQGPIGPTGNTGAVGPAGSVGPQGPQGNPGTPGSQGLTGNTGAVGPAGPVGPQGPAGSSSNIMSIGASPTSPLTNGMTVSGTSTLFFVVDLAIVTMPPATTVGQIVILVDVTADGEGIYPQAGTNDTLNLPPTPGPGATGYSLISDGTHHWYVYSEVNNWFF